MAAVTNTSGGTLRLIRVGSLHPIKVHGVNLVLLDTTSGTVPDDFLETEGAIALVAAGDMTVDSYDSSFGSPVVQGEAMLSAAYSIALSNTPADVANDCTAAVVACVNAETYDFSNPANRVFTVVINTVSYTHTFISGDFVDQAAATAAECATSLAGNAALAAVATFADNAGDLEITTLAFGTTAAITGYAGTAEAIFDFTGATETGSATAPSLPQVTVTDSRGNPAGGVDVAIKLFDAVTAGALLSTGQHQLAIKGTFKSGEYDEDAVITTDALGEADWEIVTVAGALESYFLDLSAPAGFFLSVSDRKGSDSTREEIVQSAA